MWRKKEGVVRIPENIISWKFLTNQDVKFTVGARESMDKLGKSYRESRRRLLIATRRFKVTGETDIPVPLKSPPFDHQVRAFGYAASLDASGCFADQGTGKTFITMAVVGKRYQEGLVNRVVVVSPKSVKQVWPSQLQQHAGYEWSASINKKPPIGPGCHFWVISYDSVQGMAKEIKSWKPQMIIWDECHRLKNRKSQRYKSNRDVSRKIKYRLLLSGTPIGKCRSEAWAQYSLIDPSIYGSYSNFKSRYLKMGGFMGHTVVGYQNDDEFHEKFHSVSFRVTKEECLDLPPLTYQHFYVEPSEKARSQYNDFASKLFMETTEGDVTSPGSAVTQLKLRQIAGGMVKTDGGQVASINRDKLKALRDFLEDRVDKKTIVFFSFTHEIEQAEKICKSLGLTTFILQGSTKNRESFENRFQGHNGPAVALIQVQTGAEGLTLHTADYALYYSPSYSFIYFLQSRDRIYRIGQVRSVTIGFLIVRGTVDERVVEVLESNGKLVKTTLEESRSYHLEKTKMAKAPAAGYTAAMMADSLGIETRDLRMHLRALKIEKPEAGWVWSTKTAAKDIEKQVTSRIKELANKPKKEKAPKVEDAPKSKKVKKEEVVEEAPKKSKKKAKEEVVEEAPKKSKKKPAKE